MSQLSDDLEKYADEFQNEKELKKRALAGAKLIGEIVGNISLAFGVVAFISQGVPILQGIGIPITGAMVAQWLKIAVKTYPNMSEKERKDIRAFVSLTKGVIPFFK